MPVSKNLKNSWRVAEEYIEQASDLEKNPQFELLEDSWKCLTNNLKPYTYMSSRHNPDNTHNKPYSPLTDFLASVSAGIYPTPEVMATIAECFEYYVRKGGDVGLEDVFFGIKPLKGVGNYAAQRAKNEKYVWYDHTRGYTPKDRALPLDSRFLSSKFNNYHLYRLRNMDSFLRGYRRWKATTSKMLANADEEEIQLHNQLFLNYSTAKDTT
jgi:hypothetical protein